MPIYDRQGPLLSSIRGLPSLVNDILIVRDQKVVPNGEEGEVWLFVNRTVHETLADVSPAQPRSQRDEVLLEGPWSAFHNLRKRDA